MSAMKKTTKPKFISEDINDFINESQFLNDSPKKKQQKRRQDNGDKEIPNLVALNTTNAKKRKINEGIEVCGESRQKILQVMSRQLDSRKQINENLLKSLTEVLSHLEADYNALKDNEQKLEHLTGSFMKCLQQATTAHKQKLRAFKEIHATFKKECDEMEVDQKAEMDKLGEELEEDINKLKQKLISETKRSGWETLRRSFIQAMQNDLVEGLILRGAIKPDDRPLWFDVYRAFPPTVEPKFARPKPENQPIRQILYKEDVIRAKFQSKGHGISANMLNPGGESYTKRLIHKYEQLKSQGVIEEELIEKSVADVTSERKADTHSSIPKNPESVSSSFLSNANIHNIFKE